MQFIGGGNVTCTKQRKLHIKILTKLFNNSKFPFVGYRSFQIPDLPKKFDNLINSITILLKLDSTKIDPFERKCKQIGFEFREIKRTSDEGDFEACLMFFTRMEIFVDQLGWLEENNHSVFRSVTKELRDKGNSISFYGARFELYLACLLTKDKISFHHSDRPDFKLFSPSAFFECTSARLERPYKVKDFFDKLNSAIKEKEKKGYANKDTALVIDFTNIYYNAQQYQKSNLTSNEALKHFSEGLTNLTKQPTSYGAIVFGFFHVRPPKILRENLNQGIKLSIALDVTSVQVYEYKRIDTNPSDALKHHLDKVLPPVMEFTESVKTLVWFEG